MFALKVVWYRLVMWLIKVVSFLMPQGKPLLLSGCGSSIELARTVARFGHKRVLIVTDTVLRELGVLNPIITELETQGVEVHIYDGVLPDPTYVQVEAGVDIGRLASCDSVLAIGGGSPIDAAKVIAVGITNATPVAKLTGIRKVKKAGLPLYVIPTTAGTGSEVTLAAVISHPQTHKKTPVIDPITMPVAAALDPEIQKGMPPHITAATGMDALTHAIESYLSRAATAETDRYALAATAMIFESLPRAYADGNDMQARESMAVASCYAGLAFTKAFVGYVHAIAHNFGACYGTPHGLANAIVLPYILEFTMDASAERMADLAVAAGLGDRQESATLLAKRLLQRIQELNAEIGIPRKLDSLRAEDISGLAKAALSEAHYLYPVPKYMDRAQCESIIQKMVA
jgi:alcohol dehydrogenase